MRSMLRVGTVVALLICGLCAASPALAETRALATPQLYKTVKDNVPVRPGPTSSNTPRHYLTAGQYVSIRAYDSANPKWLQTYNNTWIYKDNLSGVWPASQGLPSPGRYITADDSVPLRFFPSESWNIQRTLGRNVLIQVTQTFYNDRGNIWGYADYANCSWVVYIPTNLSAHTSHLKDSAQTVPGYPQFAESSGAVHAETSKTRWYCRCGALTDTVTTTQSKPHTFSDSATDLDCNLACGFKRLPLPLQGAYTTVESAVPLRHVAESSGQIVKTIPAAGTTIKIGRPFYSSFNNPWAQVLSVAGSDVSANRYLVWLGNLKGTPIKSMWLVGPANYALTQTVAQPRPSIALLPQLGYLPADHTDSISWSSSNPAVATVSSDGIVTAVGRGETVITVQATSGVKASVNVSVFKFRVPVAPNTGVTLTSLFGPRICPNHGQEFHPAIDLFKNMTDSPIYAAERGTVRLVDTYDEKTGVGKCVVIEHGNGLRTVYAHLNSISAALPTAPNMIKQGGYIGGMGKTGAAAGAIHLHFELGPPTYRNGVARYDLLDKGRTMYNPGVYFTLPAKNGVITALE